MSLYRASPSDGIAWITGASSGIGRQLALDLARAGYTVAATARSADRLDTLSGEAAALGGRILAFPCDVTDRQAMARTVAAIVSSAGPVALAVFNAGGYIPVRAHRLEAAAFDETFDTNFFGVVNGLIPVIEAMKSRGRGQIAVVGSVTAYGGLPTSAAYGATKAALDNMAASLKFDLDHMNIRIQIVNPGFVETPLTAKNRFAMPALMPVGKASARIVQGLKSGGFEIVFPRRLAWPLKFVNALPRAVYFPLLSRVMGWKGPRG